MISLVSIPLMPQSLLNIFKTGKVYLIPDSSYAKNSDWGEIFFGYNDKLEYAQTGSEKEIAVSESGEIFMSLKNHYEIWLFDRNGNLKSRFGRKGTRPDQFPMMPSIKTIVGNKYYVTADVGGRLKIFHLNGEYYKSINIDFLPRDMGVVDDNTLMLSGWVIWKNSNRHIVTKIDIATGETDIVYSQFTERSALKVSTIIVGSDTTLVTEMEPREGKIYLPSEMFFSQPMISISPFGTFVVANPGTGSIEYYNSSGKLLKSISPDIKPIQITQKDIDERYNDLITSHETAVKMIENRPDWNASKKKSYLEFLSENFEKKKRDYKNLSNFYPTLPYFSTLIFDNEGNLLVFEYTRREEEVNNRFSVFALDADGRKLAQASLISEDYRLSITNRKIIFKDGYLYAVCEKKGEEGVPLRLMRFILSPTPGNK